MQQAREGFCKSETITRLLRTWFWDVPFFQIKHDTVGDCCITKQARPKSLTGRTGCNSLPDLKFPLWRGAGHTPLIYNTVCVCCYGDDVPIRFGKPYICNSKTPKLLRSASLSSLLSKNCKDLLFTRILGLFAYFCLLPYWVKYTGGYCCRGDWDCRAIVPLK